MLIRRVADTYSNHEEKEKRKGKEKNTYRGRK